MERSFGPERAALRAVDAREAFARLRGRHGPEAKRRAVGEEFKSVFESEAERRAARLSCVDDLPGRRGERRRGVRVHQELP